MKGKVVMDTSALVSLGHTDLIDDLVSTFMIIVSEGVIEELEEISRFDDKDGRAAKEWLDRTHLISVMEVPRKGFAEDELMGICSEKGLPLILDDIKATKRIGSDTNWFFSIHLVFLLFHKGSITKERARFNLAKMRTERHWKENAITVIGRSLFD